MDCLNKEVKVSEDFIYGLSIDYSLRKIKDFIVRNHISQSMVENIFNAGLLAGRIFISDIEDKDVNKKWINNISDDLKEIEKRELETALCLFFTNKEILNSCGINFNFDGDKSILPSLMSDELFRLVLLQRKS